MIQLCEIIKINKLIETECLLLVAKGLVRVISIGKIYLIGRGLFWIGRNILELATGSENKLTIDFTAPPPHTHTHPQVFYREGIYLLLGQKYFINNSSASYKTVEHIKMPFIFNL